ncbi:MAG: hypothetical protein HC765_08055, partial [Brachymonas sp.]|nr:hypothetical protein [Brachymonas sp.]
MTASVASISNFWLTATPGGEDWFTASNWSRNAVPNQLHDVTIDASGPNQVEITTANATARSIILGSATNQDNTLYINGKSLTVSDPNSSSGLRFDLYADNTLNIVGGGTLALGGGDFNIHSNAIVTGAGFTLSADSGSLGNAYIYNDGTIINAGGQSTLGQSSGARTVYLENTSNGRIDTGALGGGVTIAADSFDQNGLMITRSNRIRVTGGDFTNGATGRVLMAGGTLDAGINDIINHGKIDGTGTLTASTVENHGTLAPGSIASAGALLINGDFINASSGTLSIRGFSPVSNDSIVVVGSVDLDGTLDLIASGTHAFAGGQSYQVIQSTNTPTGGFATVSGIGLLIPTQNSTGSGQFVALANPAGSIEWIGSDGDWDVAANWKDSNNINRLPQSGDTVIINPSGAKTIFVNSGTDLSVLSFSASSGDDTLLIISGGSLGIQSGATLDGILHVNGGTLDFLGLTTASRLDVSSGQVNVSGGNLTVNTLNLSGGSITIGSAHTVSLVTQGNWSGASILDGSGSFNIGSAANWVVSGSGVRTVDGIAINNSGAIWLQQSSGGYTDLKGGAVLTIGSSAQLISSSGQGPQEIFTTGGEAGTVVNAGGHMEAQSSSSLSIRTSSLSVAGGSYNATGGQIYFGAENNSISDNLNVTAGELVFDLGDHTIGAGTNFNASGGGSYRTASGVSSTSIDNMTLNAAWAIESPITVNTGQLLEVGSSGVLQLYSHVLGSGDIANYGQVIAQGGSTLSIATGFQNYGYLSITAPQLTFANNLTLDAFGEVYLEGGSTLLRSAGIVNDGLITTGGNATIDVGTGGYSGSGTLSPGGDGSVATLTIAGDADFTTANLRFGLQNASSYDKISVTGNATLAATTNVLVREEGVAFVGSGDSFNLLQSTSLIGSPDALDSDNTDIDFSGSTP